MFKINYLRDSMFPEITAISIQKDECGLRLTNKKGCGKWNIVDTFDLNDDFMKKLSEFVKDNA